MQLAETQQEAQGAVPAVMEVARRYRVSLVPSYYMAMSTFDREKRQEMGLPLDFVSGGGGSVGLSMSTRTVYYERGGAFIDRVLHEIAHVVCGEPSMEVDEGWMLMPFEWILARQIARRFSVGLRRKFLREVEDYQFVTMVGGYELIEYGVGVRRTRWWRLGVARAQAAGLLDDKRRVTWQDADWSKISKPPRDWDPSEEYPT